jgi:hypothetical protein
MSEVKLNLIDSQETLHGTIHGSVADAAVAALSAEPETIAELEAALARYIKPRDAVSPFASFCSTKVGLQSDSVGINLPGLDLEPWDAGIVVIDLAARIVAAESTYSMPRAGGEIQYHDGTQSTDVAVLYRVPDDWLFVSSLAEYECTRERRRIERRAQPALDARTVLYGRPLLEFIVNALATLAETGLVIPPWQPSTEHNSDRTALTLSADGEGLGERLAGGDPTLPLPNGGEGTGADDNPPVDDDAAEDALATEISEIHARWLMTPREDLRGQSPRDVLLARQDFIDFDLHTRALQWTFQGEGPPCLAHDSCAYRFAGFGTHEWVVYYDLIRHLLWSAATEALVLWGAPTRPPQRGCRAGDPASRRFGRGDVSTPARLPRWGPRLSAHADRETLIARLGELKSNWLEQPQPDYGGRIPAILIDNERKRLPLALRPRDMIVDEDCPMCQMFGDETSPLGMGVGFWHLDGSHMDDDFAFSYYKTREEWEAENRRREEFNKEFNRRWEERQQRIARGEALEPDPFFDPDPFPDWVDSPTPNRSASDSPNDEADELDDLIQ